MAQVKYDMRDGFPLSFYDVRPARGDESSTQACTATAEPQRLPERRDAREATNQTCIQKSTKVFNNVIIIFKHE